MCVRWERGEKERAEIPGGEQGRDKGRRQGECRQLDLAWGQAAGRQEICPLGIQSTLVGLGSLARVRLGPNNPYRVDGTGK